jgi:hypothetical protein
LFGAWGFEATSLVFATIRFHQFAGSLAMALLKDFEQMLRVPVGTHPLALSLSSRGGQSVRTPPGQKRASWFRVLIRHLGMTEVVRPA